MAWLNPAVTPAPELGAFLAKFRSRNERDTIVLLRRVRAGGGSVIGTAGGLFEFDLGEMIGWHPLPEGLE